ncbi:MAG: hypothetical protein KJO80_03080 [Gammaproteobacteria bacterium]|nr:hypothetical protein [Gammaproteobacteria bacterium]
MKSLIKIAGLSMVLVSSALAAGSIEDSKTWTDTFPVTTEKPTLIIENIWGDVRVRPGKAGEIVVSVQERRRAPDQERFNRSLKALNLDIEADEAGIALYVGNRDRQWPGRDNCRGCRVDYQFDVTVPIDTQLDVSTVNDGRIDIAGVTGSVSAANVNGPITITEMRNCDELNSVNGEVSLGFASVPGENCNIETINGDITLNMPGDAGFDVAMDLFNGRLLTQLPVYPLAVPARVEHIETGGRHQYRIEQHAGVRIGAGGPTFTISSMNGDIRIQGID